MRQDSVCTVQKISGSVVAFCMQTIPTTSCFRCAYWIVLTCIIYSFSSPIIWTYCNFYNLLCVHTTRTDNIHPHMHTFMPYAFTCHLTFTFTSDVHTFTYPCGWNTRIHVHTWLIPLHMLRLQNFKLTLDSFSGQNEETDWMLGHVRLTHLYSSADLYVLSSHH